MPAESSLLLLRHGYSEWNEKNLYGISDDDIAELNIPTGIPLHYRLDEHLKPIVAGGEYLDPEAAAAGAAAVAAQGSAAKTEAPPLPLEDPSPPHPVTG